MGWKWMEWPSSWLPSEFDLSCSGVSPSAAGHLVLSSQLSSPPSSPYSPPFLPASSSPSLPISRLLRDSPPPLPSSGCRARSLSGPGPQGPS